MRQSGNMQQYIKYARKNGLQSLMAIIETLEGEEKDLAKKAYAYWDGKLRNDRAKGRNNYA